MIVSRIQNGLILILCLMCFIEVSQKCFLSASSPDMLIIRHGRSRVRHSTEKNHIRWGLQAFDNLTLYDYDYENANGTNNGNETIFDMNFGLNVTNQTLPFGSEPFGYFSSESFNINNNSSSSNNNNNINNNIGELRLASTPAPASSVNRWSAPTSSTPKKKLAKKQIMESIRKNVEEGIEYLRTHAHLSQPTAMMPSEKSLRTIQQQQQQLLQHHSSSNDDQAIHIVNNKQNNNKLPFEEIRSSLASLYPSTSISSASPSSKLFKLQSSASASFNQNKLTKSLEHSNQMQNSEYEQLQLLQRQQKQQKQRTTSMKHENYDQSTQTKPIPFDFEMQNDDAYKDFAHTTHDTAHQSKFNQHERTHKIPSTDNSGNIKINTGNNTTVKAIISPASTATSSTTAKTTTITTTTTTKTTSKLVKQQSLEPDQHNSNGFGANHLQSHTKTLHRLPLTNNELKHVLQQTIKNKVELSSLPSSSSSSSSSIKYTQNESDNIKSNQNINNQFEMATGLSSFDELNDEQQLNDENVDNNNDDDDNINPFQFDANYEQNINFDIKDDNSNEIRPAIFRMEDIDLDDLDETSRNNRLNLMKGRDVVTNFLQIVESQHLLGANCTAGTALNLGEGVVDRYAQDRFRVEAEVAVNRANFLTR